MREAGGKTLLQYRQIETVQAMLLAVRTVPVGVAAFEQIFPGGGEIVVSYNFV